MTGDNEQPKRGPRMIDYAQVRQRIHIAQVLALIGNFWIKGNGRNKYGACPLACCEAQRCCSYDMVRSLWRCHHCKEGGNQLDLFVKAKRVDLYTAARFLCIFYGEEVPYFPAPAEPQVPFKVDERFRQEADFMERRSDEE